MNKTTHRQLELVEKIRPLIGKHTCKEIARLLNESPSAIYYTCYRNKLYLKKTIKFQMSDVPLIEKLIRDGYTYKELASKWDCTHGTFTQLLAYWRRKYIAATGEPLERLSRKAMFEARLNRQLEIGYGRH